MQVNQIRTAVQRDVPEIARMWQCIDALVQTPAFGGPSSGHSKHQRQLIEQLVRNSQTQTWVACHEKQLIGTISAHRFQREQVQQSALAAVYGLWVEPDFRRQGLGTALLDTVRHYCRLYHVQALQVAWDSDNQLAETFWRRHGFSPYEVIAAQSL